MRIRASVAVVSVALSMIGSTLGCSGDGGSGPGGGTTLTSGVALSGLSGAEGSRRTYTIAVSSGATSLTAMTSGGTGDLDLSIRTSAAGTLCTSSGGTNDESCTIDNPAAGIYEIELFGFEAYSGASLIATVGGGTTPPPGGTGDFSLAVSPAQIHVAADNPDIGPDPTLVEVTVTRSGGFGGAVMVDVTNLPAGVSAAPVTVDSGTTKDTIYLYVGAGTAPTTATVQVRGQAAGLAARTANLSVITTEERYTWLQVDAGREFSCGVTSENAAFCWGSNADGALGSGSVTNATLYYPQRVTGGLTYKSVSAGRDHACAIASDDALYCWGSNLFGQLGIGTSGVDVGTPTAVAGGLKWWAVSAGDRYTCAVELSEGYVYCWGRGSNGGAQLGLDSLTSADVVSPTPVATTRRFFAVETGTDHTCALEATTNAAFCWGRNSYGALGIGVSLASANGDAFVYAPTAVSGGLGFTRLALGLDHTCGIVSGGGVRCWGWTHNGALGDGRNSMSQWADAPVTVSLPEPMWKISTSGYATCVVPEDSFGTQCWGLNEGQVLSGITFGAASANPVAQTFPTGVPVTDISLGSYHGCTPTNSRVACWGNPAGVGGGYSGGRVGYTVLLGSRPNP